MRPIHLSLAGLHSFREKQEVDFVHLCAGGVFGIFGPTGSGKSSLLDAITLTLYGKVERATNNIQGIMNHAEDDLAVSFTFELANAEGAKRYMVQRQFKRTGDMSLRTAMCRLLHVDAETTVLADKAQDVNEQVQELLGLTFDDFTRAVVLPQGKFAEFLSLKGSDRRQMLQRLFHLEQYGDRLNDTLRRRLASKTVELKEFVAEQQGLGDASQEAQQLAQKRVKESEAHVQETEQKLKEMDSQYTQAQKIWQWQEELAQSETALANLEKRQEEFDRLQQRLQLAQEAEQLKPYVQEYEQSQKDVNEWQEKSERTSRVMQESKAKREQYQKEHVQAEQQRNEQEPYWIERLSQLKQAQGLQEDVRGVQQEHRALLESFSVVQEQEQKQEQLVQERQLSRKRELDKQQEIKANLQETIISVEQREQVRMASAERVKIDHEQQALRERQTDDAYKQKEREEAEYEWQQVQDTERHFISQAQNMLHRLTILHEETAIQHREIQQQLELAEAKVEQQQTEVEQAKEKQLAEQLASQLKTGEACPVCGSLDHPQPVLENKLHNASTADHVQTLQKKWEDTLLFIQQTKDEQRRLEHEQHMYLQMKEDISATFSATFSATNDQAFNESSNARDSALSQTLPAGQEKRKTITQSDLRQFLKEYRAQQQHYQTLSARTQSLEKADHELKQKMIEKQELLNDLKQKWQGQFPQFNLAQLADEQTKIDEKDRIASELNQSLNQSVLILQEIEQDLEKAKEEHQHLKLQLADVRSNMKQKEGESDKLLHQLQALIQTQDQLVSASQVVDASFLAQLEEDASLKLTNLKERQVAAYEVLQSTEKAYQQAETERSVALESLQQARQRLQKAEQHWQEACQESTFTDRTQVQDVLASKEERDRWKKEIEAYQQLINKEQQEKTRLLDLLAEQRVTEQQWQQLQTERQALYATWDQAVQARGAANQAWQELEIKVERYAQLEQQRADVEQQLEKLGQLQKVLRGNSFVEYIAEEQLMHVCREASERLGVLTRQRYALEVDSGGGFIIRDDANGGVRRPVGSLSGGETFLTSLALALSLSAQIQLRGEYPLQFFFLDEGFGTLDTDLLDTVVTALEHLHSDRLSVGVISHVPELRARLPRRLVVEPAEASGRGSNVYIETL